MTRGRCEERRMHPIIEDNLAAIRELAREYGVRRLEVFGSVCTSEFDPERSDVDFLVEYPPGYEFGPWLKRFHALRRALAGVLHHEVDLVDARTLRDPLFLEEATKTRRVLFDASDIAQIA
jgi:uncharacterized protein